MHKQIMKTLQSGGNGRQPCSEGLSLSFGYFPSEVPLNQNPNDATCQPLGNSRFWAKSIMAADKGVALYRVNMKLANFAHIIYHSKENFMLILNCIKTMLQMHQTDRTWPNP